MLSYKHLWTRPIDWQLLIGLLTACLLGPAFQFRRRHRDEQCCTFRNSYFLLCSSFSFLFYGGSIPAFRETDCARVEYLYHSGSHVSSSRVDRVMSAGLSCVQCFGFLTCVRIWVMTVCHCTRGCTSTISNLHWKWTMGEKFLTAPMSRTCVSRALDLRLNQLSYILVLCCLFKYFHNFFFIYIQFCTSGAERPARGHMYPNDAALTDTVRNDLDGMSFHSRRVWFISSEGGPITTINSIRYFGTVTFNFTNATLSYFSSLQQWSIFWCHWVRHKYDRFD